MTVLHAARLSILASMFLPVAFQEGTHTALPPAASTAAVDGAHRFALGALERVSRLHHNPSAVIVRFGADDGEAYRAGVRALVGDGTYRVLDAKLDLELVTTRVRPETAVERLRPFVLYAELDGIQRTTAQPTDANFALQYALRNTGQTVNGDPGTAGSDIRATAAWDVTTGDPNFVVAVIDTGTLYTHPDLAANIWSNPGETLNGADDDGNGLVDDIRGWDYAGLDNDPLDIGGHGTHTSGTIGAVGNNGIGDCGVAWRCKIAPVRFLGTNGGLTSDAILSIGYCRTKGIKVSNNSWGSSTYAQSLYDAIALARTSGHLFVAAAGNSSFNTELNPFYPACYDLDNIISVAATTNEDARAFFSNYGATRVDLGAPGNTVHSTYLADGYSFLNGTSMAAPHVTGAAVLVWGLNPAWNYAQVRSRILSTTRPVAGMQGITVTGGVLDLAAAVGAQTTVNTAPVLAIAAPAANVNVVEGTSVLFSATATDAEQGNLSAAVVWSSNLSGTLATAASFSTTALTVGVHTITARVVDAGGLSATATRTVTVTAPTAPTAPSNFGVSRLSAGVARLVWRDNSTNETGFEFERQRSSGGTWIETTLIQAPANTTSLNNTAGTGTFRYRLRARNGSAASAWSGYRQVTL